MKICMQFHANIGNVYNSLSGFIMIYLVTYWLPTFQQSHRHGTSSADIFPGKIRGGSHPSTPPWPEANLPTWLTAESALLRSHSSIVKKIADVWQTRATLAPKSEVIRSKKNIEHVKVSILDMTVFFNIIFGWRRVAEHFAQLAGIGLASILPLQQRLGPRRRQ